ncbi:MAG: hypothetical protein AB8F74_21035 [Saprospiraceae bacterium]
MKKNKHITVISLLCLWMNFGFGQSQKPFDELISTTNEYIEKYSKLSPFGSDEFIPLKKSGLPRDVIKQIKEHLEEYDGYLKDSISEFNLLLEFQGLIVENITNIISHKKFEDSSIEKLINQDLDLSIVVSDDRKLFNFSLDEKTGGTYRSRISITHYTEDEESPTIKSSDGPEIINQHGVFEGDGFNAIYSIDTKEGTKYVLVGHVRGCSYCFESNIMLVKLNDGMFEEDFSYSVNSRSWEEGISYNSKTKVITVDYITDDLTTDCDCSNYATLDEEENYYLDNDDPEPMVKRCHCTFQFNDLNFELVKESWEKVKE